MGQGWKINLSPFSCFFCFFCVYFDFGNCGFRVFESEDGLSIVDGVVRVSDDVALCGLKI